jgi:O-6-methylguanine DNA methyltransferase
MKRAGGRQASEKDFSRPIFHRIVRTSAGRFCVETTERGLFRIRFPSAILSECHYRRRKEPFLQKQWAVQACKLLRRYFAGGQARFHALPIDDTGLTTFERRVLRKLTRIPRGAVRTYGELAHGVGRPRAARAVGNVLRKNRLPIIFPCHRIVRSGGALGGYSAGIDWKKKILSLESKN